MTDREAITERTFDPQGRVAISQEIESRSGTATEPGGEVTVASNLPEGDANAGGNGKDIRVKNNVFWRKTDLLSKDFISSLANFDLARFGIGLALLIKSHYHHCSTIATQ